MPMTQGLTLITFSNHPSPLTVAVELRNNICILRCAGQLALGLGADTLNRTVNSEIRASRKKIVLNLQDVTTIDSAGVGEIADSCKNARRAGGDLVLSALPMRIVQELSTLGILSVIKGFDTDEEAVSSFPELAVGMHRTL